MNDDPRRQEMDVLHSLVFRLDGTARHEPPSERVAHRV